MFVVVVVVRVLLVVDGSFTETFELKLCFKKYEHCFLISYFLLLSYNIREIYFRWISINSFFLLFGGAY